jgi:NADH-quinone oxidoreductase subunit M
MNLGIPYLSLLVWTPILGGLWVLYAGDRRPYAVRYLSLSVSLIVFAVSVCAYMGFDTRTPDMQFVEFARWIDAFRINYHLGIDGISLPLILLTTFTTVLIIIAGWEAVNERPLS